MRRMIVGVFADPNFWTLEAEQVWNAAGIWLRPVDRAQIDDIPLLQSLSGVLVDATIDSNELYRISSLFELMSIPYLFVFRERGRSNRASEFRINERQQDIEAIRANLVSQYDPGVRH